jgi:hypothetical protein
VTLSQRIEELEAENARLREALEKGAYDLADNDPPLDTIYDDLIAAARKKSP